MSYFMSLTLECPRGGPTGPQRRFFAKKKFLPGTYRNAFRYSSTYVMATFQCKNIGDRWRHYAMGTISVQHNLEKIDILIATEITQLVNETTTKIQRLCVCFRGKTF